MFEHLPCSHAESGLSDDGITVSEPYSFRYGGPLGSNDPVPKPGLSDSLHVSGAPVPLGELPHGRRM